MAHSHRIIPTHPGIVLWTEFLQPYGITRSEIAKATGIPNSRLTEIFSGRRSISAGTAIRIGKFLNLDPQNFINLQTGYDRIMAEIEFTQQRPPVRILPCPKVFAQMAAA
jgi:addiction module HigA family antidote